MASSSTRRQKHRPARAPRRSGDPRKAAIAATAHAVAATANAVAATAAAADEAAQAAETPTAVVPAAPRPPKPPTPAEARIANAVALAMSQFVMMLPQLLAQSLADVLRQIPVRTVPLNCATCQINRMVWTVRHDRELKAAYEAYAAAMTELAEDDPRRRMLNPVSFLPARLQPSGDPEKPNTEGLPPVEDGIVMVGGTLYCGPHAPGAPEQASRRQILVANGNLTGSMLAQAAAF